MVFLHRSMPQRFLPGYGVHIGILFIFRVHNRKKSKHLPAYNYQYVFTLCCRVYFLHGKRLICLYNIGTTLGAADSFWVYLFPLVRDILNLCTLKMHVAGIYQLMVWSCATRLSVDEKNHMIGKTSHDCHRQSDHRYLVQNILTPGPVGAGGTSQGSTCVYPSGMRDLQRVKVTAYSLHFAALTHGYVQREDLQ